MKPPIVLRIAKGGKVRCLYTDAIRLGRLGTMEMQRASRIEFDRQAQQWEVWENKHTGFDEGRGKFFLKDADYNRLLESDEPIELAALYANPSYEACRLWEINHFNAQLAAGELRSNVILAIQL